MVRTTGASRERREALLVELVDGVANRLFVARERLGDGSRSFPSRLCEQNLAAT